MSREEFYNNEGTEPQDHDQEVPSMGEFLKNCQMSEMTPTESNWSPYTL